jgi:hypothetical protein
MTALTSSAPMVRATRTATLAATGSALAALVIVVANYNVPKGENGGVGDGISTAVICAIVAAVAFLVVLPRVRNRERAAVVLGSLSVLSIAVFWSGVTPILAAATIAAGLGDASQTRRAAGARVLAIAVTVLVVAWTLATSHLF